MYNHAGKRSESNFTASRLKDGISAAEKHTKITTFIMNRKYNITFIQTAFSRYSRNISNCIRGQVKKAGNR
jgi:hypothetical protein